MTSTTKPFPKRIDSLQGTSLTKNVYCYACHVREKWKEHFDETEHILRTKYFLQYFIDNDSIMLYCKVCSENVPKRHVNFHAIQHKLIPWYRPETEIIDYFQNFIGFFDDIYWCYLCGKEFKYWYLATTHINDNDHQLCVPDFVKQNDIDTTFPSEFYKDCVLHSIFPNSINEVKCLICNCIIPGYKNVKEHIAGIRHSEKRATLTNSNESLSSEAKKNFVSQPIRPAEKFIKYFKNFIGVFKNGYWCYKCSKQFDSDHSVISHIEDDEHLSTVGTDDTNINTSFSAEFYENCVSHSIFPISFDKLKCLICNLTIGEYKNAEEHIPGVEHRTQRVVLELSENILSHKTRKYFTSNFAKPADASIQCFQNFIGPFRDSFWCYACKKTYRRWKGVISHIQNVVHQSAVSINNENIDTSLSLEFYENCVNHGIFPKSINEVECFICNCIIPGYKNVEEHTAGIRHSEKRDAFTPWKGNLSSEIQKNCASQVVKPADTIIGCFKNFLGTFENFHWCYMCAKQLNSWQDVISHIEGSKHRRKVGKKKIDTSLSSEFYKNCISNGIFCKSSKNFICFICDRLLGRSVNAYEHMNGVKHREQRAALKLPIKTEEDSISQCAKPTDEFIQYFKNFIGLFRNAYWCYVCIKQYNSWQEAISHIQSVEHRSAVDISDENIDTSLPLEFYENCVNHDIFPNSIDNLKCFICNRVFPGYQNAKIHISERKHREYAALKLPVDTWLHEIKEDSIFQCARPIDEFIQYFKNFIGLLGAGFWCYMCKKQFDNWQRAISHIQNVEHQSAVNINNRNIDLSLSFESYKNFVSNGIFLESNFLRCFVCNCQLGAFLNAQEHIKGKNHKKKYLTVMALHNDSLSTQESINLNTTNIVIKPDCQTSDNTEGEDFNYHTSKLQSPKSKTLNSIKRISDNNTLYYSASEGLSNGILEINGEKTYSEENLVVNKYDETNEDWIFMNSSLKLEEKNSNSASQITSVQLQSLKKSKKIKSSTKSTKKYNNLVSEISRLLLDLKVSDSEKEMSDKNKVKEHISSNNNNCNNHDESEIFESWKKNIHDDYQGITFFYSVSKVSTYEMSNAHSEKNYITEKEDVTKNDKKNENWILVKSPSKQTKQKSESESTLTSLSSKSSKKSKKKKKKSDKNDNNLASEVTGLQLKTKILNAYGKIPDKKEIEEYNLNNNNDCDNHSKADEIFESWEQILANDHNSKFFDSAFQAVTNEILNVRDIKTNSKENLVINKNKKTNEEGIFIDSSSKHKGTKSDLASQLTSSQLEPSKNSKKKKSSNVFVKTSRKKKKRDKNDNSVNKLKQVSCTRLAKHLFCHICKEKVKSSVLLHSHSVKHFWSRFVPGNKVNKINLSAQNHHSDENEESCSNTINNLVMDHTLNAPSTSTLMDPVFALTNKLRILHAKTEVSKSNNDLNANRTLSNSEQSNQHKDKKKENSVQSSKSRANNDARVTGNLIPKFTNPKYLLRTADIRPDKPLKVDIYKIDSVQLQMINLSIVRCYNSDKENIYCLICREKVSSSLYKLFEHFRNIKHNNYLVEMIQDHMKFLPHSKQLSDLSLAKELIEDVSDEHVHCYACNKDIKNNSVYIKEHSNANKHMRNRALVALNLEELFSTMFSKIKRDWYNVRSYWCVPCRKNFHQENLFYNHLYSSKTNKHTKECKKFSHYSSFVFDYCPTCTTLFYGFRETFAHHCQIEKHKYFSNKTFYVVNELPSEVEEILLEPESVVNQIVQSLDLMADKREEDKKMIIEDLENIVNNFIESKAYLFGSRACGLATDSSDLDIFLDCDNRYYKGKKSDDIVPFLTEVEKSLEYCEEIWKVNRTIVNCSVPIIRATHVTSNIVCDISFPNGLTTECTKLINAINKKFPICRKLILFIRQWIFKCNLSGEKKINNYAVTWMLIYYLQTESLLPSIMKLIKTCGESKIIGGWEAGVNTDFELSESNRTFKSLLTGFFKMYAEYDYRNFIICPLLGEPIQKKWFNQPKKNLPGEMETYKQYCHRKNYEPFRIDSPLCVQDPFDLSNNITKAIQKFTVLKFKTFCALTVAKLEKSSISNAV